MLNWILSYKYLLKGFFNIVFDQSANFWITSESEEWDNV